MNVTITQNYFIVFYFLLFFFYFYNCIVPVGFLPWEIQIAFPGESQLWQSCPTQPTVNAGFLVIP